VRNSPGFWPPVVGAQELKTPLPVCGVTSWPESGVQTGAETVTASPVPFRFSRCFQAPATSNWPRPWAMAVTPRIGAAEE
jgi:hypothetical protein